MPLRIFALLSSGIPIIKVKLHKYSFYPQILGINGTLRFQLTFLLIEVTAAM
jgi:hypothetical protein